jgi:hypothetical protein
MFICEDAASARCEAARGGGGGLGGIGVGVDGSHGCGHAGDDNSHSGEPSSEPPPWASSLPLARPLVSPRSNLQQGEDGADGAAEAIAWTTAPAPSAYSPVDTPIWLRWPTGVSNNLCRSSPLATPPHLSCTYSFASIPCLISNFILKFSHCQYISFMDVWMY